MMKASPCAMLSPNTSMTPAVQAGNAPMCSGKTTCCATTSPFAFISAQEASCDSRTMVEKPVRNSEFCISCTMPERLAFSTSRLTASMGIASPFLGAKSSVLRHDHVLPFVYPADLAGTDHRRAIELREDRRPGEARAHIEPFALIDRAVELRAIEARALRAPPCIRQCRAGACEFRQLDRRHETDTAYAVGHDLDRLLRRHVAEHARMLLIEGEAQLLDVDDPQRFGRAGDGDLVTLAGVAHVERPFDADVIAREAIAMQFLTRLCRQPLEHVVHGFGRDFAQRRHLRLDVVVLDVRHQQTDCRKHPGIKRHNDAGHA